MRTSLERLMKSLGLAIETFASAKGFLRRGAPDGPACLVLDVRMPGMSGLGLQEELAEDPTIPIIFITGHGNIGMTVRAMKAGAVDFLEKPFDDQELLEAVHRAFEPSTKTRNDRAARFEIQHRIDSLTPREQQVFELVVTGMANKQIGEQLGASEKTIKVHRARVMQKLQAPSLAKLVQLAEKMAVARPIGPGADL